MNGKNRKSFVYSDFKGVDYIHAPSNVSACRAVDGMNMVRSEVGKVHKRTGYEADDKVWQGGINGVHFLRKNEKTVCLVHCKNRFYADDEVVYDDANDSLSKSVQIGDALYILDGKNFLMYDGVRVCSVRDKGYVPVVSAHRTPFGEGKKYEQVNILTSKRKEGFIADGSSKEYVLSRSWLSEGAVSADIFNDDGTSYTVLEGEGLTVDREMGKVKFTAVPPASKNTGEDNVYITYEKKGDDSGLALEKCTVMTAFGAGGKPDTLFLSGNPEYPGREWFSQPENPTFFGVENTDAAMDSGSKVVGYSTRGDKLFVHRENGENNLNILVRSCFGTDENYYSYPVVNALSGPGTVGKSGFVNMENDALFLSEKGIYAIAESEADERHFTQLRSLYINPHLIKNENLCNAQAVGFNDFYVLAAGSDIYLLDTLQKSFEKDKEYSGYQYEAYHWQIPDKVKILFVQDGRLCFGTENGRICRFYTDYEQPRSFNDNGVPIKAVWQTGEFYGNTRRRVKNFHRLWVVCAVASYSKVSAKAMIKGIWKEQFSDDTTARYFSWSRLKWSKFTWSADKTPKLIMRNIRIKNADKTALRLENSEMNEPLGIYEIGIEYNEGGFYR